MLYAFVVWLLVQALLRSFFLKAAADAFSLCWRRRKEEAAGAFVAVHESSP